MSTKSNPKDPVGTGATTNGGYVIAPEQQSIYY